MHPFSQGGIAPSYSAGALAIVFGTLAWLVARQHGVPGGWQAFLWGFLLGPVGLAVVAVLFRPER